VTSNLIQFNTVESNLNQVIHQLNSDNDDLRNNVMKLQEEQSKLIDMQQEHSELQQYCHTLKQQICDKQNENKEINKYLEQQLSHKVDKKLFDQIESKLEHEIQCRDEIKVLYKTILDENDKLRCKIESLKACTNDSNVAVKELDKAKEELLIKTEAMEALKSNASEVFNENSDLREKIRILESDDQQAEIIKLTGELTILNSKNLDLKCCIDEITAEKNSLKEMSEEMEMKLKKFEDEVVSSEIQHKIVRTGTQEAMKQNLVAIQEQLQSEYETKLEEVKSSYETEIRMLEEKMTHAAHDASKHNFSDAQHSITEEIRNEIQNLKDAKLMLDKELREKNLEYSSIKVDMHKAEINFQKIKKRLQDELDYEKTRVSKLTAKVRSLEADRIDASFAVPAEPKTRMKKPSVTKSTNTSTTECASPEWGGGSGIIKEVRLYELEHKTFRLEKELKKEKEAVDFYRKRGNDWKSNAKWYEEILDQHKIRYRKQDNSTKSSADKENNAPPLDNDMSNRRSKVLEHNNTSSSSSRQAMKPIADESVSQLERRMSTIGLGASNSQTNSNLPNNPGVEKMKKKAQDLLGVNDRNDSIVVQKERPPNDCPTQ